MRTALASTLLLSGALAFPANLVTRDDNSTAHCFPYGDATLPSDLSAPSVSRDDWWCPSSTQYGFQGFAYPLEDGDCDNDDNQSAQFSTDFAAMKKYGATMVVTYLPTCNSESLWTNLVDAAVENNIAIIAQIAWDLSNNPDPDLQFKTRDNIYSLFDSDKYKAIAPYVIHSVEFATEPIADYNDGCDGEGGDPANCQQFLNDMADIRSHMNQYGVPVGTSEDWDRPNYLRNDDTSLTDLGKAIDSGSDFIHAHIQPYYNHNDIEVSDGSVWNYVQDQVNILRTNHGDKPILVTETQWAWGSGNDHGDRSDIGPDQYAKFFNDYNDNCELFKEKQIGWFIHTYDQESTFSFVHDDGTVSIPDFYGKKC